MRRIGSLNKEPDANRFRDYLLTRGIDSKIEAADANFDVWVMDEDLLDQARQELAEFRQNPEGERYVRAVDEAVRKRQQQLDEELEARRRQIDLRTQWDASGSRRHPITFLLIVLSGMATFATRFGDNREIFNQLSISRTGVIVLDDSAYSLPEVRQGEIWRLVTPIFLHLSVFHLLMNMYWMYILGSLIEVLRGRWRYLSMIFVLAVFSNLAQYYWSGPSFGGMSGVIAGLFGFAWYKTQFQPDEGYNLPQSTSMFFFLYLVLCAVGLFGNIANAAHFGGLFAGIILAWANSAIRGR